jgi:hypothetical protein
VIYIIFDSDIARNPDVQAAAEALADELRRRGAIVHVVRLPDDGTHNVGLDDFLAARGAKALRDLICDQVERNMPATVRMADVEAEHVTYLWYPRLPRGKFALVEGDPGTLKTFITLKIGAAFSCGDKLPGATETVTGKVLLMSAEDGLADTVRPRLDRMKANLKNIIAVPNLFTLDAAGLAVFEALLTKHRPLLVVIDPLVAYMGGEVDLHRANEMRALTARLAELAGRYGTTILAVRHWRKASTDKSIYRGLGSIDLSAAARSILITGRDESGGPVLAHAKCNVGPLGPSISFRLVTDDDHDTPRLEWLGVSALTAEQIAAPPKAPGRPPTERETAKAFLHDRLEGREVEASAIEREATEHGIKHRTLMTAKHELGVVSTKRGRAWWWKLPKGRK